MIQRVWMWFAIVGIATVNLFFDVVVTPDTEDNYLKKWYKDL